MALNGLARNSFQAPENRLRILLIREKLKSLVQSNQNVITLPATNTVGQALQVSGLTHSYGIASLQRLPAVQVLSVYCQTLACDSTEARQEQVLSQVYNRTL